MPFILYYIKKLHSDLSVVFKKSDILINDLIIIIGFLFLILKSCQSTFKISLSVFMGPHEIIANYLRMCFFIISDEKLGFSLQDSEHFPFSGAP